MQDSLPLLFAYRLAGMMELVDMRDLGAVTTVKDLLWISG